MHEERARDRQRAAWLSSRCSSRTTAGPGRPMWRGTQADTQSAEGSSSDFSVQPAPAFRLATLKVLRPIRGTSDRTTLRKRCTHAAWTGRSTQFSSSFSVSFPRADVPRDQRKFRAQAFRDEFFCTEECTDAARGRLGSLLQTACGCPWPR